jgi:hypothetical protein
MKGKQELMPIFLYMGMMKEIQKTILMLQILLVSIQEKVLRLAQPELKQPLREYIG